MLIGQSRFYRATVRIRRDRDLKPECECLDGKVALFIASWRIEADDDRYPGEWAMVPLGWRDWPIAWIASGDLTNLTEVPIKGSLAHVARPLPDHDHRSRP